MKQEIVKVSSDPYDDIVVELTDKGNFVISHNNGDEIFLLPDTVNVPALIKAMERLIS